MTKRPDAKPAPDPDRASGHLPGQSDRAPQQTTNKTAQQIIAEGMARAKDAPVEPSSTPRSGRPLAVNPDPIDPTEIRKAHIRELTLKRVRRFRERQAARASK
jgi:hypothetical protein